ncbi:MAG: nuclear transport factor 2 family protein [Bryobacteraceae bacterium]
MTHFRRGDVPYIVSELAPDVFWRQPASVPWGGDYLGAAEARRFFVRLNEVVETTGFEIEDNIEAKDQVVTDGYYNSRNRATGKDSRARFTFRWQFVDGKVFRYEALLAGAPIAEATHA